MKGKCPTRAIPSAILKLCHNRLGGFLSHENMPRGHNRREPQGLLCSSMYGTEADMWSRSLDNVISFTVVSL